MTYIKIDCFGTKPAAKFITVNIEVLQMFLYQLSYRYPKNAISKIDIQYINLIIKEFRRLFVVPNKHFVRKMSFSALTEKLKTEF